MTKAVEAGMPKMKIEEAAARRQARVDCGEETIVGVNKYRPSTPEPVDILDIDNTKVRESQVARLQKIRASRDEARVQATLEAITEGAASGEGNMMALAVEATRARAPLGEISDALENSWGRYQATLRSISGVYGSGWEGDEGYGRIRPEVDAFEETR